MSDLVMPSDLPATVVDSPNPFSLLVIVFLCIVGMVVALVLLETAQGLRKHPR